ncbi:MAG: DegT/DnrJ/EryC1/StrS family aminotransferase [bacterium]|nr:DegT/DnrJ/EryC1/StrS family aminotransferase [bacterium]
MNNINMLDLQAEFKLLADEVRAAVDRVFDHQRFVGGPEVTQLEERLADLSGCRHAVAVSSGTDALVCALMSLGIGAGDEVVTTPFTFFATAGSICRLGAKPVFVDLEPDTFNLDPARLEAAITDRTRLILPVHLFGQCAEMDAINEIAARRGDLPVLADAAQAIGATYRDRPYGALATAATLSFYPTKNLGGFGEGGMILTDDTALADKFRLIRNHGQTSRYHHELIGGNFRLDTLQAALLLAKLDYLPRFNQARRRNAARYDERLAGGPIQAPVVRPHNASVYHQYSIICDDRDSLAAHLQEHGIGSGVYYAVPLHLQPCFADLGYKAGDLPISERTADRILSLPIHPMLSENDVDRVIDAVEAFAGSRSI